MGEFGGKVSRVVTPPGVIPRSLLIAIDNGHHFQVFNCECFVAISQVILETTEAPLNVYVQVLSGRTSRALMGRTQSRMW